MDPRIINLLFAVMAYVGSKEAQPNPFVKGFREDGSSVVYDNMVQALMDCEEFFPQVDEMVENIEAVRSNEELETDAAAVDKEIEDYWNQQ